MTTVPDNRLNAAIRTVFGRTANVTGQEFFESIVQELAGALGADGAMVANVADELQTSATSLALFFDGAIVDGITYDLEGTPCADVAAGTVCHYPSEVTTLFPEDVMLGEMGLAGYAGVPLRDQKGKTLGILSAFFKEPTQDEGFSTAVMLVFAGRVASEMERSALERERRELERSMLHAQKLESLGLLAGGIAHDFNNLLCGVLGAADLAGSILGSGSRVDEELGLIRQSVLNATELCNQLLAYSGKGRFVIEPVDISALIADMSRILEVSVTSNTAIHYRLDPALPRVAADATQLRQIVLNLVMNASDALGADGGNVMVATRGFSTRDGARVVLEVVDDGCGMDAETRARIFDPFFTTKATGRGLGLAAVHGIVRGHDARIEVKSDLGAGSSFLVHLPALPEDAPLAPATDAAVESVRHDREGLVLLIEDNVHVQVVAKRMLESFGFDVLVESGGAAGVRTFESRRSDIDLVLLDLIMPGMSGEETFEAIRGIDPTTRILVTSGATERDATRLIESDGPTDFIKKPFTIDELSRRIEQLL